jgi:hypothetical protein
MRGLGVAWPVVQSPAFQRQRDNVVGYDEIRHWNEAPARSLITKAPLWTWRGDQLSPTSFAIRTNDTTPEVTVDKKRGTPQQITLQRISPSIGIAVTLPLVLVGTHYQATYPVLLPGTYRVTISGVDEDGAAQSTTHTLVILALFGLLARRGPGIMGRGGRGILIYREG